MRILLKQIFALALAFLTLTTSVGIKIYFHKCLTCNVTDISLIDEVSACHHHHLIHHINHNHKGDNHNSTHNDDKCCLITEAYIQYHYNNTVERTIDLSFLYSFAKEILFCINTADSNETIVTEDFTYCFINPPPIIISGIDMLKSIHQLKFDYRFLS
ncbi:MAG TPA: hypothetical protein PLY32_01865 [Salinivirgaceae bacterium]|mgnify:CR=1 FL=1|nr:hypothetical protein [Salinivirgaceae bacterium]